MEYKIGCTKCGAIARDTAFRCAKCGSILEVRYSGITKAKLRKANNRKPLSRYIDFLPIETLSLSLGEGGTPLKRIRSPNLNGVELFLKLETTNPTKTFKDRGSAVEISKGVELGVESVCCASTGNMGLSVAHYSRKVGIKCTIFISRNGNERKIAKIKKQGANIVRIDGDFNRALIEAEKFSKRTGAFVCGDYHFRKEGQKTVGFEIMEQMKRDPPDYIFMPVGNATLFSGVYKGLLEFRRAGIIKTLPRLVAVQSEQCAPLVRAWKAKGKVTHVKANTEADAIAVGYPTFGFEGIEAIRMTKGSAVAVSEMEIENAVMMLETFKVYAELGGGTGFAGFLRYRKVHPERLKNKRIVVVVTGNNEGVFKAS